MSGFEAKVLCGERITAKEAEEIYRWPLAKLGEAANARRNLAKGKDYDGKGKEVVTYMVDRNINYTNVCDVYCKFCAFYRTEKDADHYVLSQEQIDQKIDELVAVGGNQILLQGGHHPKLGLEWYLDLLRHLRRKYPQVNVHGFSPPEFNHFAEVFGMSLEKVIEKFREAGLGSIPGGRGRDFGGSGEAKDCAEEMRNRRLAQGDGDRPRNGNEIQCDDDVWACGDSGRKNRAFGAVEGSAGSDGGIHRIHLLDVSAGTHRS